MLLGEAVGQHRHFVQKKSFPFIQQQGSLFCPSNLDIKAPLYTLMFKVFSSILGKAQSKETLFAI